MTSYKGSGFYRSKSNWDYYDLIQGLWVCTCQKRPLKIARARAVTTQLTPCPRRTGARGNPSWARCGRDVAAEMGALGAGAGAAGPPHPKRARGFMIKSCKGSTWPSWIPRALIL